MMFPALCFIHGGFGGLLVVLALVLLFAFAFGGKSEPRRSRLMTRAQWEQSFIDEGRDE